MIILCLDRTRDAFKSLSRFGWIQVDGEDETQLRQEEGDNLFIVALNSCIIAHEHQSCFCFWIVMA